MADVTISDAEGKPMTFTGWEGEYMTAGISVEQLKETKHMEFRADDIFLCVYPKSGTNWCREILTMLLNGKAERVTSNDKMRGDWLEAPRGIFPIALSERPSPRVLMCHRPFPSLPEKARKERKKIIFLQRDPKDVAVSHYHMMLNFKPANYEGTWNGFFPNFLEGKTLHNSWFDHVKSYRKLRDEDPDYPILYLRYEDMKLNPASEIRRVSDFLGLPENQALVEGVARLTDFQEMKTFYKDNQTYKKIYEKVFKTGQNEMYRKGIAGDWKNRFTVAQSEVFDAEYEKQMGHKYGEDDFSFENVKIQTSL